MKKIITSLTILLSVAAINISAQTITYSNYTAALTTTQHLVAANTASFNLALAGIVGNGVTWNASSVTQQVGPPEFHLIYASPSATPFASIYPNSNHVLYDPALGAAMNYTFYKYTTDSILLTGIYDSLTGAHVTFQNAARCMKFPLNYLNNVGDTYSMTIYSDATTVSGTETGDYSVYYGAYGTLILPQDTFTNVAMIEEATTNISGPLALKNTWLDLNTGKALIVMVEDTFGVYRVMYSPDNIGTGISEIKSEKSLNIYPNPCTTCEITRAVNATDLTVTDIIGRKQNATFSKSPNGYYINLLDNSFGIFLIRNIKTGEVVKFVKE